MQLGDRIRELRKIKGATLKDVSDATELSVSFLSDVERNRTTPSLGSLNILSQYFGMNLTDMLGTVSFAGEKTERALPPGLGDLMKDPEWGTELNDEWLELLSKIELQGKRPQTKGEWLELYLSLRRILKKRHLYT